MSWLKFLIFCFICMPMLGLVLMIIKSIIVKSGAIWRGIESTYRFYRRFRASQQPDVECALPHCTHQPPMRPAYPQQTLIIVSPSGNPIAGRPATCPPSIPPPPYARVAHLPRIPSYSTIPRHT